MASTDLLRDGPLVVRFFREHSRPYCNMELEALQWNHSQVSEVGAQIVVLTPELERHTRALHKKLNLAYDILTDLHLKTAEQFRLVFVLPDYLRDVTSRLGAPLTGFTTNRNTDYRRRRDT